MVHPKHFRKGIAKRLIYFIENEIDNYDAIVVSTGTKNEPAVNFYLKNGFLRTSETKIAGRLSLTSFRKQI